MSKKVLVTGGAGYIGSAITKLLCDDGYQVVVYDDLSVGHKDKVDDRADFVKGDILDEDTLDQVFAKGVFDVVIHCAAKKVLSESESQPGMYYQTNVGGTINVLSAMAKHKVPKLIFSSTAAVYAPTESSESVTENSPVSPASVYGRSKLMAETLIEEFVRTGQIKSYVILRYFNVAGDIGLKFQEKNAQGVFPLISKACKEGATFMVTGVDYDTKDGSGVRDYIHLHDLAQAHLLACEGGDCEVFNLGTSDGYTVYELIDMFEEKVGKKVNYEPVMRRPGDLGIMLADASKVRERLGWRPKKTLAEMVESMVITYELK